jgi:hypothetical protein
MDARSTWVKRLVGKIITVLVAIVVFLWFLQVRSAPTQLLERRACENAYREARTAAETLSVDARNPIERQPASTTAATCGALRKAGRL